MFMQERNLRIERLIEQNQLLIDENQVLRQEITKLQVKNVQLQEKIDQLSKDSNNSSKPPSSDIVKPDRKVRKKVKRKRADLPRNPRREKMVVIGGDDIRQLAWVGDGGAKNAKRAERPNRDAGEVGFPEGAKNRQRDKKRYYCD